MIIKHISHLTSSISFRNDVDICHQLSKKGQAPVSSEQAMSLSQQSGCVAYVETSSKVHKGASGVASAFEAAAIASGVLSTPLSLLPPQFVAPPPPSFRPPPPPPVLPPKPKISQPLGVAVSPPVVPPKPRRAISTMALNHSSSSYSTFSSTDTSTCSSSHGAVEGNYHTGRRGRLRDREGGSSADLLLPSMQNSMGSGSHHAPPLHHQSQHFGHFNSHTPSYTGIFGPLCTGGGNNIHSVSDLVSTPQAKPSNVRHHPLSASRTTILDCSSPKSVKTTRDKSMLSLLSIRTPKTARKNHHTPASADKTVTIKCQRLNAESKQYEEVDVEVPAPIYETLRFYNDGTDNGGGAGGPADVSAGGNKSLIVNNSPSVNKKSIASKIKSLFGM